MPPNCNSALQPELVRKRVFEILRSHSNTDMALDAVADDTPLLEEGLCLDSIDLLDSIVEIEEALDLRLRGEDMTEEVFATAGGFADHVCGSVAAAGM